MSAGSGAPKGGVHRPVTREPEAVAVVIADSMALLQAAATMVVAKLVGSRKPRPDVTIDYASDRPQALVKVRAGDLTSELISRSLGRAQRAAQELREGGYGTVFVVRPGQRDPATDDEVEAMEGLLRQHRDMTRGKVSAPPGPPRDGHQWVQRIDQQWVEVPITPKGAALEALTEAAQFALGEGASLDEVRLAVFRAMGLAPDSEAQEATS